MTREALWLLYVERNPHWLTDGASFTAEGLRKFFDQAFEMGQRRGREDERGKKSRFEEIFGKI